MGSGRPPHRRGYRRFALVAQRLSGSRSVVEIRQRCQGQAREDSDTGDHGRRHGLSRVLGGRRQASHEHGLLALPGSGEQRSAGATGGALSRGQLCDGKNPFHDGEPEGPPRFSPRHAGFHAYRAAEIYHSFDGRSASAAARRHQCGCRRQLSHDGWLRDHGTTRRMGRRYDSQGSVERHERSGSGARAGCEIWQPSFRL